MMKKFCTTLVCCFIPSRKLRRKIRNAWLPESYKISGSNNKILCRVGDQYIPCAQKIPGLNIDMIGNNNTITIDDIDNFHNVNILMRCDNANLKFGKKKLKLHNLDIHIQQGNNQKLTIGDYTFCWGAVIKLDEQDASLIIGKNCMISDGIHIHATDSHPIMDKDSMQVINRVQQPLIIGDHCWLAQGVRILKNAHIPNNTILGAGSVVSKHFDEEYTVLGGNPAKVVKRNVTWDYNFEH